MSQFAKVTSLDVLRDFKAALQNFQDEANVALSESYSDVQRTVWWVTHDQKSHWQREHKKRADKVQQCKAELFKKQLESNDARTSAVVERKALAAAERKLEEAEQKLRAIAKWTHALEREQMLFKAACQQLAGAVAGDLPNATARIERMIESLHAYISLQAPTTDLNRSISSEAEVTSTPGPSAGASTPLAASPPSQEAQP